MNNALAINIVNKTNSLGITIKSREDTYEIIKAITQFKGAVIQFHILNFFNGDTTKGLEDIIANTNESLQALKQALKANIDRLNMVAEAEQQARIAEEKKQEARRLKLIAERKVNQAKTNEDKRIAQENFKEKVTLLTETELKADITEEMLERVKLVNDHTIQKALSGTTIKEKVAIIALAPKGATAKEVKKVKTEYVKLLERLRSSYKTLSLWPDGLLMLATQKGMFGNAITAPTLALAEDGNIPTEDEIMVARKKFVADRDAEHKRLHDEGVISKLSLDEVRAKEAKIIQDEKDIKAKIVAEKPEDFEMNKLKARASKNVHYFRVPTRTKSKKLDKATKDDMVLALLAQGFTEADIREFRK